MLNVSSPKTAREILEKYSLSPLKKFGQNFLVDDNIVRRIADSVKYDSGCVLEVGAGLGALTIKLAQKAQHVLVYEIDKGLCNALQETLGGLQNVSVFNNDILKAPIEEDIMKAFGDKNFFVAANLPYYITSPCIMRLLEGKLSISGMVLMMQKEVAQRLTAMPGSSDYGAITAAVAFFCSPRILFDVSRNCFYPKPDVSSSVVYLDMTRYDENIKELYLQFVKGLFSMRRKTVFNNLIIQMGYTKELAEGVLNEAKISPQRRAETLSKEDFVQLATAKKKLTKITLKKQE